MEKNEWSIYIQKPSMNQTIASFLFLSLSIVFCNRNKQTLNRNFAVGIETTSGYDSICEIPVPPGYERITAQKNSFGEWLRGVRLKKDSRIYLYDGRLKNDQSTHFAVLDMPVGNKDLQQCADAILRLRSEYFFNRGSMDAIHFKATDGTELSFARWLKGERYRFSANKLLPYQSDITRVNKRMQLEQFLEVVFSYCGTISLDKETRQVDDLSDLQIGDVFIKAGSPGHAMIVIDAAVNNKGEKVFMLGQGLMPEQSIHIVKNPADEKLSPWYRVSADSKIITPQWVFYRNQLKRWQ